MITKPQKAKKELVKDIIFIGLSAVLALWLLKLGVIDGLVNALGGGELASFISGIFFTSSFTIVPSAAALTRIEDVSRLTVALWGAAGAVVGDLFLFLFIRDRLAVHMVSALRPSVIKHILHSFHFGFLKWLGPLVGALIIASPLPDELGLTMLGLSKTKISVLLPVSFLMNLLGIYLVLAI